MDLENLPLFSFLSVLIVTVFSFVSVVVYITHRRREREAYYRSEMLKKLADSPGGAEAVLTAIREEDRRRRHWAREGMKIGGLVVTGVGLGLLAFFHSVENARPVGFMPLGVGLGLLAYVLFLAPKDDGR